MILDTSALVAILYGEPERERFAQLIHDAESRRVSAVDQGHLARQAFIDPGKGPP